MINKNSLDFLGQFYFSLKNNFKQIYQNSNFYEKKFQKLLAIIFNTNQALTFSPQLLSIKIRNIELKILWLIQFGKIK